jgi:8-amino-7-oxononanoate synthase
LFTSGFAANLGTISALARPGDVIFSDALNHASIIDGCRLSRAHVVVVPHLDTAALETAIARTPRDGRAWVVTETYFSMDGDSPDLPRLRQICTNHRALLIVDEAHALGVFGTDGSGLCSQASIQPDVLIGTLGKAIGCQGAFVAAPHLVRTWLWNRARSLVFSTAPSPLLATLTLSRVRRAQKDGASRLRLTRLTAYLRQRLAEARIPVAPRSYGPIVPVILGDNQRVVAAAARLARRGFLAQGIRPPTVPRGTARLRITVSADLQQRHLDELAATLATEHVR